MHWRLHSPLGLGLRATTYEQCFAQNFDQLSKTKQCGFNLSVLAFFKNSFVATVKTSRWLFSFGAVLSLSAIDVNTTKAPSCFLSSFTSRCKWHGSEEAELRPPFGRGPIAPTTLGARQKAPRAFEKRSCDARHQPPIRGISRALAEHRHRQNIFEVGGDPDDPRSKSSYTSPTWGRSRGGGHERGVGEASTTAFGATCKRHRDRSAVDWDGSEPCLIKLRHTLGTEFAQRSKTISKKHDYLCVRWWGRCRCGPLLVE